MPKQTKEKTYTTLTEVGIVLESQKAVLDDLLQKFATIAAGQDRIIDQNMSTKMDELTVHVETTTNAAFQDISQKLDSLKSEIYQEALKRAEQFVRPVINKLETENLSLKMRVERLEKIQTFNMNKEHTKKLLISSDKFKKKDGKSIENIIKEFLPTIDAKYTSSWIGDYILLNFPTFFDKQSFTKNYYSSDQKDKRKGIYLSDYVPAKYSYEQNRMKRVAGAMKKAKVINGYRVEFKASGPSLVISHKVGDKTTYLRASDSPDTIDVTSFPTIKLPPDFHLLLPTREQYEEEKQQKNPHKRSRSEDDLSLPPSKVGNNQA